MQHFIVTENHLKLLRRAWVSWDGCEFGAPAIDCKRPYGNGDVFDDIAKIIGVPGQMNADGELSFSEEQETYMMQLHRETKTALQIILATGLFEEGLYEASDCDKDWRQADRE